MNRDDIIRMAREVGLQPYYDAQSPAIERFYHLVHAAGEQTGREACAKVCDDMEEKAEGTECCKWPTPADCAAAIRARGEKK